jgi:hypothetical protein
MSEDLVCRFEAELLAAGGKGPLPQQLQDHVNQCEKCRETLFIVHQLEKIRPVILNSEMQFAARRIWLRAQLEQRRSTAKRLEQTIPITAGILTVLSVTVAVTWEWPQIAALAPQGLAPMLICGVIALALLLTDELVVS